VTDFSKKETARADLLLEDGQTRWSEYSFLGVAFRTRR